MAPVVSQNGWPANIPTSVSRRPVPGSEVELTVRYGASGDLLLEVASCFDQLVQDIDTARGATPDDWGFAERPVRGALTGLSNHSSGTAIDLNATKWPLGSEPSVNLNPAQIAVVRAICAATGGCVRWGGDYTGRKDPMHFEINDNRTEADCARALTALRAWHENQEDDVALSQDDINRIVAGVLAAPLDNPYTPAVGDTMPEGVTLSWAAANAGRAYDEAKAAHAAVDALTAALKAKSVI